MMKYDFTGLMGHSLQREYLYRSITKGKVANSYLFHGQEGIGKKIIAMEMASILNCTEFNKLNNKFDTGCECVSCLKIKKGIHPDVTVILSEGLKEIKIDQVRDGIEELIYLKPYEGQFKIAIVDNADLMNINAQNAFLKTLEEPPANSIIILISSKPQFLLPTIVSRCQRVEFFSLPNFIIKELLNNSDFTEDELELVVTLSRGSPLKASILDRDFLEQRRNIIEQLLGLTIQDAVEISDFTLGFTKDKSIDNNDKINLLFEILYLLIHDVISVKSGMDKELILNGDIYSLVEKIAKRWSFDKLFATGEFLEEAWGAVFHTNVNRQYVLENLAMQFALGTDTAGSKKIG